MTEKEEFKLPEDCDLTLKQRLFVEEWVKDGNATRAAIAAGYSPDTAKQIGYENLTKPYIIKYIKDIEKQAANRAGITVERILREQAKLAFFDPASYYNEDGTPKLMSELDEMARAAIKGIETVEHIQEDGSIIKTKKYVIADKKGTLSDLSKTLGMIVEKKEVTGKDGKDLFPTPSTDKLLADAEDS